MKNSIRIISGFLALGLVLSVYTLFSTESVFADGSSSSQIDLDDRSEVFWHSMASDLYYSHLSSEEKKLWDRLDKACMEVLLSDDDVSSSITVDAKDLGINETTLHNVVLLFINSNPQYFFLCVESGFNYTHSDGSILNLFVPVYSDFEDGAYRTTARENFRAVIRFYLEKASEAERPEEKERIINNLMCDRIDYDTNFKEKYNQSAYSATQGKSVCAGYAKLFEGLMNACGIRCGYVTGPAHAWNIINLHGYWYYVDVTNNDRKTLGGAYYDTYYNTNEIISEVGKIDDDIAGYVPKVIYDGLEATTANKYTSRYFTVNGVTYFIVNDLDNSYGRLALIVNDVQSAKKTVNYNSKTYSVINYTQLTQPADDPADDPADEPSADPVITYSWKKISGNWFYVGSDGSKATGFVKIGKDTYYFDKNGIMKTGWQSVDGSYYYMNKSGVMLTGWQKISKKWYYLNKDGKMLTDLNKIDGKWYFFNTSGALQTGWKKIDGSWYYLTSNGAHQSCWKQISKKWYYFNGDGKALTGLHKLGGTTYLFSSGGVMQTGWQKLDGKWYYFKGGAMVCGKTLKISGKKYTFGADGVML